MKLENQLCSIKQAEELKQLGVLQESLYYWPHSDKWGIMPKSSIEFKDGVTGATSMFNCAELMSMIQNTYGIQYLPTLKLKYYYQPPQSNEHIYFDTLSKAVAAKLIYYIKNGWVSVTVINERLKNG